MNTGTRGTETAGTPTPEGAEASNLSLFEMFRLGPGPSSSHTVGPMRAGRHFAASLVEQGLVPAKVRAELFGSSAATGIGHGTNRAVLLGLTGAEPATVTTQQLDTLLPEVAQTGQLHLLGCHVVPFDLPQDLLFEPLVPLPFHTNSLRITASDPAGEMDLRLTYHSTGGGFVSVQQTDQAPWSLDEAAALPAALPHRFTSGADLLEVCAASGLSIAQVVEKTNAPPGHKL